MIDLGDFYPDFPEILARKVAEIPRAPVAALGPLCEEACVYFRTAAIAEVLVGFNSDGFHHMLMRSALTRLYLLGRMPPSEKEASRFCKISRANGFFDALAADRADLAGRIIAVSAHRRNADFEYEDDYAYVRFLYGLLLGSTEEDQQAIIDAWSAAADVPSAKYGVCLALLGRDAGAFCVAFEGLLDWRKSELEAEMRSLSRDEMAFAGNRHVYVEGLALLRLADMLGLATEPEYRFCPRETRQPALTPFPDDLYPALPPSAASSKLPLP